MEWQGPEGSTAKAVDYTQFVLHSPHYSVVTDLFKYGREDEPVTVPCMLSNDRILLAVAASNGFCDFVDVLDFPGNSGYGRLLVWKEGDNLCYDYIQYAIENYPFLYTVLDSTELVIASIIRKERDGYTDIHMLGNQTTLTAVLRIKREHIPRLKEKIKAWVANLKEK